MYNLINLSKLKILPISEIVVDDVLVNLGRVIEIEEFDMYYSLIIDRLNEKQVFKFDRQSFLTVTNR